MGNIKFIANTTKQNYGFKQTMQNNDVTLEITPIVDGKYLNLTGAIISLNWLKPDNELISIAGSSITTSGSNVLVVLPKDCTSVPGEVKFELVITQSNKQVSTFPLSLNVAKSVYQSLVGSTSFATVVQDINEANASASQTLGQVTQAKEEINTLIQEGGAVKATDYKTDKAIINGTLSTKTSKEYVDTLTQSLASGSPKGTYATLSALQSAFPTGNNNIYLTSDNGNWNYWDTTLPTPEWKAGGVYQGTGLADYSVKNKHLDASAVTHSKLSGANVNIYDQTLDTPLNIIDNSYINSDGSIAGSGFYYISKAIQVRGGYSYKISTIADGQVYVGAWYDSSNTWISAITTNTYGEIQIVAPSNATYLKLNIQKANKITTVIDLIGFPSVYSDNIAPGAIVTEKIPNEAITYEKISKSNSIDLFDATKITSGFYLDSTGSPVSFADYVYSDYIQVEEGQTYEIYASDNIGNAPVFQGNYYDINKVFIGNLPSAPSVTPVANYMPLSWTAPTNAKYVRINTGTEKNSDTYFRKNIKESLSWLQVKAENLGDDVLNIIKEGNTRWTGKKANFLGDSITYGYSLVNRETEVYHAILKELLGLEIARNYGISSTKIAKVASNDTEAMSVRYVDMDNDADLITVLGGTNDYGHSTANGNTTAPFGAFTDRTADTFYGALHVLYSGLLTKYPNKKILVITPLPRTYGMSNTSQDERVLNPDTGKNLLDYINAIREVAEYYSLPVLDLHKNLGFTPIIDILRNTYMPDCLHPNATGHNVIAKK